LIHPDHARNLYDETLLIVADDASELAPNAKAIPSSTAPPRIIASIKSCYRVSRDRSNLRLVLNIAQVAPFAGAKTQLPGRIEAPLGF
jgi:hypothetical protein